MKQFDVNRGDVAAYRWREAAAAPLSSGQARLSLGPAAFTANNVSYAVMGDQFGYWNFFPVDDAPWGCIPVWGYADVAEEKESGLSVGERIYGYFPMGTELIVTVDKLKDDRFLDVTPHRVGLPQVYNEYQRTASDPSHEWSKEAHRTLFFPLAATAFGLADFCIEQDFMGGGAVACLSASSKTALATAMMLRTRKGNQEIIGLTSARHVELVTSLNVYDRVLAYEAYEDLDPAVGHVMIDFAGNAHISAKIHQHLGDNMLHNALVGATHVEAPRKVEGMNRERSVLFFMPGYAAERIKQTGGDFVRQMQGAAAEVADSAMDWMSVREANTPAEIEKLYTDVLNGALAPNEGGVIHFDALSSTDA